jgi:hypothetical protein
MENRKADFIGSQFSVLRSQLVLDSQAVDNRRDD